MMYKQALFTDPEFPPNYNSVFPNGQVPPGLRQVASQIQWKRASELSPNPKFILDGISRFDMDQGMLGDCWFLGSAVILAFRKPRLFQRVVPVDQGFEPSQYTGKFHFRFWVYGTWTEVVVDDYLPVIPRDRFVFASNRTNPNEFWAPLLEKAFAKMFGGYTKLETGVASNALVMLTGGIPEQINLKDKAQVSPDVYSLLVRSFQTDTLAVAAITDSQQIDTDRIGLVNNHVYAITGCKELTTSRGKQKLLRLLNPWGQTEWKGAWSDNSREMLQLSPEKRAEMNFVDKDEGEFWMAFPDFEFYFDALYFCHLEPHAFSYDLTGNQSSEQWYEDIYNGDWKIGRTAGGATSNREYWINPQVLVKVTRTDDVTENKCTMIVSLMEKAIGKFFKDRKAVGFDLYQVNDFQDRPLTSSNSSGWTRRYQCLKMFVGAQLTMRFQLTRGTYVIIPYLYRPNEESEFMLRIFTQRQIESRPLSGTVTGPTKPQQLPLSSEQPERSHYQVPRQSNNEPNTPMTPTSPLADDNNSVFMDEPDVLPFPVSTQDRQSYRPRTVSRSSTLSYRAPPTRTNTTLERNFSMPATFEEVPKFPVGNHPLQLKEFEENLPPFPVTPDMFASSINSNNASRPSNMATTVQTPSTIQSRRQEVRSQNSVVEDASQFPTSTQFSEPREPRFSTTSIQRSSDSTTTPTSPQSFVDAPDSTKFRGGSVSSTRQTAEMNARSQRSPLVSGEIFSEIFHKHTKGWNALDAQQLANFLLDISNSELQEPIQFSLDVCRSLVFQADRNGSGKLDFQEADRIWKEVKAYRDVFLQFATGQPKVVDIKDLDSMFEKLGFPIGTSIQRDIIKRYGSGLGASALNVSDFVTILFKLTALFESFEKFRNKSQEGTSTATFERDQFLRASLFT